MDRIWLALAFSLALHALLMRIPSQGIATWLPWFGSAQVKSTPAALRGAVRSIIVPTPAGRSTAVPPPGGSTQAVPDSAPPGTQTQPPQQLRQALANQAAARQQQVTSAAETTTPSRPPTKDSAAESAARPDLAVPSQPTENVATTNASSRSGSSDLLPPQAQIRFLVSASFVPDTTEAIQTWRTAANGGEFRIESIILGRAGKPVFGAVASGIVGDTGLLLLHQTTEFQGIKSAVNQSAGTSQQTATGKLLDAQALAYDLGFNPDRTLGDQITLIEDAGSTMLQLTDMADNVSLEIGNFKMRTRYFEWRTPDYSTAVGIWIALDHNRLPAQIRVTRGTQWRVMTATGFSLNADVPPQLPAR